jgi:hypothetical protein
MLVSLRKLIKESRYGVVSKCIIFTARCMEIHQLIRETCGRINMGVRDDMTTVSHAGVLKFPKLY